MQEWISPLVKIKQASDLHTGVPMQAALLSLLSSDGFLAHLSSIGETYQKRCDSLYHALTLLFGEHCECDLVESGMFIWLRLLNADARELTQALLDKQVVVVPGDVFFSVKGDASSALRLNFSHSSCERLGIAAEEIKSALIT